MKIANFADIRLNNGIFMQKKKNVHFKIINLEKKQILAILNKMVAYLPPKKSSI